MSSTALLALGTGDQNPVAKSERVPELDGIRGLAILLVMAYHVVGPYALPGHLPGHATWARVIRVAGFGAAGVQLFFVLSGFLIGGILLRVKSSDTYFSTFYFRRALRILPPYYALLLFVALLRMAGPDHWFSELVLSPASLLGYLAFLPNIVMAAHSSWGIPILGVSWSLGVEEQFYLTLPVAVRLLSSRALAVVTAALVVAAPVLRYLLLARGQSFASYMLMPCEADCLGIGVLIAIGFEHGQVLQWMRSRAGALRILGAICLAAAVFYNCFAAHGLFWSAAYITLLGAGFGALLVNALALPGGLAAKCFRLSWLRHTGIVAYGAYLFHQPCIEAISILTTRAHAPKLLILVSRAVAVPLALGFAHLSWKYFEQPLVRLGHRKSYEPPRATRHAAAASPA
ncbi:MAG: acyltransferase [Acidobacteria bacterium]|nr:acyltransferase [Acidobacteriota bacterium]